MSRSEGPPEVSSKRASRDVRTPQGPDLFFVVWALLGKDAKNASRFLKGYLRESVKGLGA